MSDVFFYGLFMDEDLLRQKGARPRAPRKAVVHGHRLHIGRRALLVREAGSRAYGMVFSLDEREIASLYDEPGLDAYRPEPVAATFDDGTVREVTTFNLRDPSEGGELDVAYAAKLRAVLERLGFPRGA